MGKLKSLLFGKTKQPDIQKYREHDTIQYSDQTRCRICGKVWDTNDPDPPKCEEYGDDQ